MNPTIHQALESLLLPPGLTILLLGLILLGRRRFPRLTTGLILLDLLLTYAVSVPVGELLESEGRDPAAGVLALTALRESGAQAIVIPGMGRYPLAPEYGGVDTLAAGGLVRARYGAWLHRRSGLPILVTGGRPFPDRDSEAELMRRVLTEEFGVPVRWLEEHSRTTWENAAMSRDILAGEGISRVILVTHARDMARAEWSFRQVGLEVIPAPTILKTVHASRGFLNWLPNPAIAAGNVTVLHEWLGGIWYRLWRVLHG